MIFENITSVLNENWLKILLTFGVVFIIYVFINTALKKILLNKFKTKKMKHNIIMFTNLISYLFIFFAILFLVLSFTGVASIGLTAGLLTAALGWALQRPITGIAAWIMVIITKPFQIGDRIIIGDVRGDVMNMTLTHIYLGEFGGTIGGEETSGRYVIIPNAFLFERNVINYTSQNEYILDEVAFTITYKSHLDLAKSIAKKAAEESTKEFLDNVLKKPFIRTNFQSSGVDIRVRYYTVADKRQEYQSKITEEIFKKVNKNKKVDFAYPHTQVILDKK